MITNIPINSLKANLKSNTKSDVLSESPFFCTPDIWKQLYYVPILFWNISVKNCNK